MSNLKVCSITNNEKPQLFTVFWTEMVYFLSERQVFMNKETQPGAGHGKALSLLTKLPELCVLCKQTHLAITHHVSPALHLSLEQLATLEPSIFPSEPWLHLTCP